ncbi:NPCBM/NEW2 domain-containing protein [Akkermansiaceae bacterium]|nr:NPCBM/NEW2 domain-containing protein [Akkermansiaceae bacterium]MDA7677827.1 NPCBM/NEW2 domain-containing protein [Akkermansiaceae bacterium]MDB4367357.1 NPCBM/NEW2 domain-containing protein [Akkermansiaceae bacterium]
MKFLPLIILLTSSLLGLAEEEFPVLSLQRKKWEEARITAQAKVDKSYLLRLQELKKDSVKKGDLDAARAFDKAIKGEAKGDEEEPATLTKMRTARAKALEAAFKPVDKQYWEDLKLLKGYTQRQGDLEKMEVVIAEINKVTAPYANQNKALQKDASTSLFTKPREERVEEISLTRLKPFREKVYKNDFKVYNEANTFDGVSYGASGYQPPTVKGKVVNSFIKVTPPAGGAILSYKIPDGMNYFTAVGTKLPGTSTSFKYIISIDDEVVFESKELGSYEGDVAPFIVEIPNGSKTITLAIDEMGSNNNDHSVWANPMFRAKKPTLGFVLSLK